MPYIPQDKRDVIDPALKPILDLVGSGGLQAGDINYILSMIIWTIWMSDPRYTTANTLVGAMECAKLEFLRRKVNEYENKAVERNGDLVI
jgi:hypothetical protein